MRLNEIIKDMIRHDRPSRTLLSRGLYLSYQPGNETTLTIYREGTFPSPNEIVLIIDILVPLIGMPERQEYETEMRTAKGKQYGCVVLGWTPKHSRPTQPTLIDVQQRSNHNYASR